MGVRAEATQARRLGQIGLPKTSTGPTCEPGLTGRGAGLGGIAGEGIPGEGYPEQQLQV